MNVTTRPPRPSRATPIRRSCEDAARPVPDTGNPEARRLNRLSCEGRNPEEWQLSRRSCEGRNPEGRTGGAPLPGTTVLRKLRKRESNSTPHASARARLLLALLVPALLLVACTRIGIPEGWSSPVVDGDTLYVGTMDGDFRAIELESGAKIWDFDLTGEEDRRAVYGRPAVLEGKIYFGGYDGIMYALTDDGRSLWDREVGDLSPLVGGPVVADGVVMIGSSDGTFYAFDAGDGSRQWVFPTGNRVWSTPVAQDGVVYFGSLDHNVYALNISDGSEKWRFNARGGVTATPLLHDGRLYIGSFASVFYALDAETGSEIWRFDRSDSWFWGGAATNGDLVFAPSLDGMVYALDRLSGDLVWTLPTRGPVIGAPAVVSGRLVTGSSDGRVWLRELGDGDDVRSCDIGSRIRSSITAQGDLVLVAVTDHSLRALAVTPSGADEEWAHFSNRPNPLSSGEEKAC